MSAAVEALERAVAQVPRDARILSDLSAAYFVRAHQEDDPHDLVLALDSAVKAREMDSSLREACFNLALVLERLHLGRLAREQWSAYLSLDRTSGWAGEANAHLQELGQPSGSERWQRELPALEAAALQRNREVVRRIVDASPQLAREYAMEVTLGAWGDAVLKGDRGAAACGLRIADEIGAALRAVNGDPFLAQAVQVIERTARDSRQQRELARGSQEIREGMRAYRVLSTGVASAHFAKAYVSLRKGGSPLQFWALCGLARCHGYQGHYREANQAYRRVLAEADRRGFSSLAGWTHWGLAWIASRQGQLMKTLGQARAMERSYEKSREAENLGTAQQMVGESLFLLGQGQPGWRYLFQALGALIEFPTSLRRHVLLQRVATGGIKEGLPSAGLQFQEEGLRIAEEVRDPLRRTEARWSRAKILGTLGRFKEALADLRDARAIVKDVAEDGNGLKLRADVLWTEAEVLQRLDPQRAMDSFTLAIAEYRKLKAFPSVAYASFEKARVERTLGLVGPAQADLETAFGIVENPASKIGEEDLRLSYSESIQEIYDEMILTQWQSADREGALATLERSRSFPALALQSPVQALKQLPLNVVVVEYALLPDRLLIWVIDRNGTSTLEKAIEIEKIDSLVGRFVTAAKRGTDEGEILDLASRLHDLLIPALVATLPANQVIYFVPDKALNKLPFAALWSRASHRFFVEDHRVAITPSLEQLVAGGTRASRLPASPSALLVGNPTFDYNFFRELQGLPGAEDEIAAARGAFQDALTLTGRDATKTRLLEELDRYDIFAFAGHAVVNSNLPSRSFLVLAPDGAADLGVLLASEIGEHTFQRLRLVVLSACSSVGPRAARGAGLAGLARPFLAAGARTVVGTIWDIGDRGTEALLADLYRAVAGGQTPVEALRQAQLGRLHRGDGAKGLRLWGGFEVVGGI
jgi:CHAT domain-containing protein